MLHERTLVKVAGRLHGDPIALRLQQLEAALYGSDHGAMSRMARHLNISPQRWHNATHGRGLSVDLQIIIVQRIPSVTADWLLIGERRGLTYEMIERLDRLDRFGKRNDDTANR